MALGFFGFGNIARALVQGLRMAGDDRPVWVFKRSPLVDAPAGVVLKPLDQVLACETLVLAVKPQQWVGLAQKPKVSANTVVISVMAGLPLSRLRDDLQGHEAVVRAMPNLPMVYGQGMTGLVGDSPQALAVAAALFSGVGQVVTVSENELNAVTALSGSGPAFLYRLAESAIQAGCQMGLSEADARRLFAQAMVGAGTVLLNRETSPKALVAEVASPGGTTEAGLNTFADRNIDPDFQAVIVNACRRAQELSTLS